MITVHERKNDYFDISIDKGINRNSQIIANHPLLSREEEMQLFKTLMTHKGTKIGREAGEKLFLSNIRLVLREVSHYKRCSPDILSTEDLIQAGNEGLCIAIDRFDPKYNTKLSTYAVAWIKLKIFRLMVKSFSVVTIPAHVANKSHKYHKIVQGQDPDDSLTDKELMEKLEISERELKNIRMAHHTIVSLNDTCYTDADGDSGATYRDIIPDAKAKTADVEAMENETCDLVREQLAKLSSIQRDILTSRYLNDTKEDLSVVGKRHGISGERVRQIEYMALKKLRKRMKSISLFH